MYNCLMQSIPETNRPFFQEYDFEQLDHSTDGDLVIERLLAYRNRDEVRWLIKVLWRTRLRKWLSEAGARRASPDGVTDYGVSFGCGRLRA